MFQTILVAVDGSEGARKALDHAAALAERTGGKLILVHVLEPPPVAPVEAYGLTIGSWIESRQAEAQALLRELASKLRVPVETVITTGPPAQAICAEADARKADLIVAGSRGMGAVGRLLLGSVSDRLVHQCSQPVTIVH